MKDRLLDHCLSLYFSAFARISFYYLCDRVYSIFSGNENFDLAHGLRQLTRDVKHDVRTLNFRNDITFAPPRKHRMTFGKGRCAK